MLSRRCRICGASHRSILSRHEDAHYAELGQTLEASKALLAEQRQIVEGLRVALAAMPKAEVKDG